jgi:uncharacterized protein (TIGR02996 family)
VTEREALYAAVLADRSADAPRLVFADHLEESGDPARAEFVRVQCEAAGLHPDSNRRAALERRAGELFRANGLPWWRAECDRLGLPPPAAPPTGWRRAAASVGLSTPAGRPYKLTEREGRPAVTTMVFPPGPDVTTMAFDAVFARGFADEWTMYGPPMMGRAGYFDRLPWAFERVPAAGLRLVGAIDPRNWSRGFRPLRGRATRLTVLNTNDPAGIEYLVDELHPTDLRLGPVDVVPAGGPHGQAVEWAVRSLAVRRLARLHTSVPTDRATDAVAAARLENLTDLSLDLTDPATDTVSPLAPRLSADARSGRLARIAGSSHMAGVVGLSVRDPAAAPGYPAAAVDRPAWRRLERLTLDTPLVPSGAERLAAAGLPTLTELAVTLGPLADQAATALADAGFVPRLRHLRVSAGRPFGRDRLDALGVQFLRLADRLDADLLRTLRFTGFDLAARVREELTDRFGERVRFD